MLGLSLLFDDSPLGSYGRTTRLHLDEIKVRSQIIRGSLSHCIPKGSFEKASSWEGAMTVMAVSVHAPKIAPHSSSKMQNLSKMFPEEEPEAQW